MSHSALAPTPQNASPVITPADVADLAALARDLVGITLTDRKAEFLMARLARRLAATGMQDYPSYRRLVRESRVEQTAFAEALTTHTTSFFRERAQYDWLLKTGFAELHAAEPRRDLVVWSAACSTGQEGYTALMVAQQARDAGLWNLGVRLIGSDISRPVVRIAAQGVYPNDQIASIPDDLRRRFLLSSRNRDGRCRIVPELRQRASWRIGNLVTGDGLDGISADVVFLRNVLIYFDDEVRARVLDNIFRRLRPGGYLLTGHTESGHAKRDGLQTIRPSILRKVQ